LLTDSLQNFYKFFTFVSIVFISSSPYILVFSRFGFLFAVHDTNRRFLSELPKVVLVIIQPQSGVVLVRIYFAGNGRCCQIAGNLLVVAARATAIDRCHHRREAKTDGGRA
jgi:hypothetical protein